MYEENNSGKRPEDNVETKKQRRKRERSGRIGGRLVALCICCVLLGGILSGAAFYGLSSLSGAAGFVPKAADDQNGESAGITSSTATNAVKTYTSDGDETYSATDIYYNYASAVVGITTELTSDTNVFGQSSTSTVSGSGFVISKDGYILTNAHVVAGATQVTVSTIDGATYDAELIGYDSDYEVGVLKIETENNDMDCVVIGSVDDVLVGDSVNVIGNPLGELTYSLTSGIVSALDREINIDGTAINVFQISAAVNAGNSGGPVFSSGGQVVGIVTAKTAATGVEGLGFAITIDDAVKVAQDIIVNGYVTGKPYFGITVTDIDSAIASYYDLPYGVYVKSVTAGSCAQTAGMVVGDIITALGEHQVTSTDELASAKKSFSAGDTTTVTVYRNGQTIMLDLTFDEEPLMTSATTTSP